MTEPPNLSQQIQAIVWAMAHVYEIGVRVHMRNAEMEELRRRLEAAAETLKTIEFTREVAR